MLSTCAENLPLFFLYIDAKVFPYVDQCYKLTNIFFRTNLAKKLASSVQNTTIFCKNLIVTVVVKKNAIFPPKIGKNRRKL
jgi:hypothetical protein